ncbi:MAG: branched-chain amino acid aminotransferase [Flavobacteriales bacterium]|nr:branched-chain amino acid aminotransferase [Flavobacteriales bacterium]MCB9447948.1 branched-chain amino acid aminotransferase [Flavobacteriales bacterium]
MSTVTTFPVEQVGQSRVAATDFENLVFGTVFSDHMFVSNYNGSEWADGRIMPFGKIQVSPALVSLHYGQAIFEGLKAYRNASGDILMFRPQANARRMNRSAERMCMPSIPEDYFVDALKELVRLDAGWIPSKPGYSLYIRPVMFATDDMLGVKPSKTYGFYIITCPVGAFFNQPLKLKIETKFSRAADGGVGYAKAAGNYGGSMYPQKVAQDEGFHQVIWTDSKEHKYVEEAGAMNVAFVIGDKLVTPNTTTGTILEGITRDSVLTLARDMGVTVEERRVEVKEVLDAIANKQLREAFGIGTAATIAPIHTIGHEGKLYDLTANMQDDLSKQIAQQLDQIRKGEIEDKYNWVVRI